MKYLKKFNEAKEEDVDKFVEFCEDSLAYLIDEGFYVGVSMWGTNYKIFISKKEHNSKFQWSEVKEELLPFYELLKEKYKLFDYLGDKENPCYMELVLATRSSIDLYDKFVSYEHTPTAIGISSIEIIVDLD